MEDRGWQTIAWGVVAVVVVLVALRSLGGPGEPPPPVRIGGGGAGVGTRQRDDAGLYVHVSGAVRRPGLYRAPAGARVAVALRRAGGPLPRADLSAINLAARLEDGQQVHVPVHGAGGGATADGAAAAPLSLGSATAEQLEELEGIGPTLAERIVEHRRASGGFGSIDDLSEVEGIGEKRLEALEQALAP